MLYYSFFRDSTDLGPAKAGDLQSTSTLEQFMAKLCLHHQRQVVDAFGFLQTEVKAVASSSSLQASSPVIIEKSTTPISSLAKFEGRSRNQRSEKTHALSAAISPSGVQEPLCVKNKEFSHAEQPLKTEGPLIVSVKTGPSIDHSKTSTGDDVLSISTVMGAGCKAINVQPKCLALRIVKNRNSGSLETKHLNDEDLGFQHLNTGTIEQGLCTSDLGIQASSSESDIVEVSSEPSYCVVKGSLSAHFIGSAARSSTVQRTSQLNLSPRTARKSRKGSHSLRRDSTGCHVINGSDNSYDTVYVGKPITDCELQSQNRMLPRKNARKSTRGYQFIGQCLELKTVRTLARKSAENGSGNCPVSMPEMTTSVTPKQALSKPDGVPPMDIPFTGDCMETGINKKPSDQPAETDVPGDVMASEDLIAESQTGQMQQSKEQISSVVTSDQSGTSVQQVCDANSNDTEVDLGNPEVSNGANINASTQEVELTTKETLNATLSQSEEAEDKDQNVAPEETQSPLLVDIAENGALDSEGQNIGSLKNQNVTKDNCQTECIEVQAVVCPDKNAQLQLTHGTETSVKQGDIKPVQDKVTEPIMSEERLSKEQPEECKETKLVLNTPDSLTKKKTAARTSSDRCLRSRVSKGIPDQIQVSDVSGPTEMPSDIRDKDQKTPESKRPLKTVRLKPDEEIVPCQDSQSNSSNTENQGKTLSSQKDGITDMVCTRQKQKLMMVKETENEQTQNVLAFSKDEGSAREQGCGTDDNPVNVEVPSPKTSVSPGKSLGASERMPLRNSSRQVEQPVSKVTSPVKNMQTCERMPLRNRKSSAVNQPVAGDLCSSPTEGHVEKLERIPLRSRESYNAEQIVNSGSCISPNKSSSESMARMPLRRRNSSTIDQHVSEASTNTIKGTTDLLTDQLSSNINLSSKKTESTGHMPLRSGTVLVTGQLARSTSTVGSASESPSRMSLRRSNNPIAEKMDSSATSPKNKKLSPKPQKMSKTSGPSPVLEEEQNPNSCSVKFKTDKPPKDQVKDSSLADASVSSVNQATISPIIPSPSKFLEALNGEENQHLISDLNNKFDKMQKGWVQMDKEGQPAPKPKNKSDRLKEIWKSKKRVRKPKSLEQQRFSPVQMLFMKSYDLPSICRWLLQSTETKSLVIVKKVNTRLPSETQLCFHTSASVPGSSNGVFPSLQAERLKKHLKKFAIASPVKSNPKNKRLIAKALAQGGSVSKGKEKQEPSTATRISTKPHSYTGLIPTQPPESHSKITGNAKNPASARILRKYSNMREKMQVQQNSLKKMESSLGKRKNVRVMPKTVSKETSTGKSQRAAIVKKVKVLAKKAKAKSAVKERPPKSNVRALRGLKGKAGTAAKRSLPKVSKPNLSGDTKTTKKKETSAKTDKSPQTKTDIKKLPPPKSPESSASPSQAADGKPPKLEDQVLTRSQRKIEATLAQTGSPKSATKRGGEASPTPAKRTRTSK